MTMMDLEVVHDLSKPRLHCATSPNTIMTHLLPMFPMFDNKAAENQANRSQHLTGTPIYMRPYDAFPTTSMFHHDQTETTNYGEQQQYYQYSNVEISDTKVAIITLSTEQAAPLQGFNVSNDKHFPLMMAHLNAMRAPHTNSTILTRLISNSLHDDIQVIGTLIIKMLKAIEELIHSHHHNPLHTPIKTLSKTNKMPRLPHPVMHFQHSTQPNPCIIPCLKQ